MYKPPKAGPVLYLRSAIYWLVMVLIMAFFAITGLLTFVLPFRYRYAYLSMAPRLCVYALRLICGVNYKVEFTDGPVSEGAAVLLSNHQSAWETLAYTFLFPPQVWVLKKSLMLIPFFGWGAALLKPIAIDRSAGTKALDQVVEQGRERLKAGIWVVIFPEGTRVPVGGHRRFKAGGATLAQRTGFPVIPVAHNAGRCWPRNSFIKYPGKVTVRVGPKIETTGKTTQEINETAETWIRQQMESLNKG